LIGVDYADVGKVQYLLGNEQIEIIDSRYAQSVDFEIRIPQERVEEIQKKITEITCARAVMEITGSGYYMDKKNS